MICKTDDDADNIAVIDEMLFKTGVDVDRLDPKQAGVYRFMMQVAYTAFGVISVLSSRGFLHA